MQECTPVNAFTGNHQIAAFVLYQLGYWLLLVVFVWSLNTMLRQHLDHPGAVFKFSLLGLLSFVGALTCAFIGLTSYLLWTRTEAGYRIRRSALHLYLPQVRLQVVYYVFYLLSVLAAGGLSLKTTFSLRSRKHPGGVGFLPSTNTANTNGLAGSPWLDYRSYDLHASCVHTRPYLPRGQPSRSLHQLCDERDLDILPQLLPSPQLHLHHLHREARILEQLAGRKRTQGLRTHFGAATTAAPAAVCVQPVSKQSGLPRPASADLQRYTGARC